ncbi:nucleotidyltransferase domain-containing protein [Amycolatopsis sp. NPDC051371]|uniref:nucleotidyltransferase domain-containing protein n=1 Tax=Amycolatopsis sp. NPDC051371 TaxID=3155800 RepID=UPI0034492691
MTPAADSSGSIAETAVDQAEFRRRLSDFGVPGSLIDDAWEIVAGPAQGVLLYGSYARREASAQSDLDILVLSDERTHSAESERVSVALYTSPQLREAHETLYGMHLVRDGVIIHDSAGVLAEILATFSPPDPDQLLERVRQFGVILDVTDSDRSTYLPGLVQVARYLLRTATYALALRDGDPCFSVEELAVRFGQPELTTLLSSHPGVYPEPTPEVLTDLTDRLSSAVGSLPQNRHRSLRALIVTTSVSDPDVSHLATFALGNDATLPYTEIPKVVL